MSRKTQRRIQKMLPYITVLMAGMLIIFGTALFVKPKETAENTPAGQPEGSDINKNNTNNAGTAENPSGESIPTGDDTPSSDSVNPAESSDNGTTEPETSETEPQGPTVSAIDALSIEDLVGEYYKAKTNCDADTLNRIVDTKTKYKAAEMAREEGQFIDHYDGIKVYTVPGPADDYFISYVQYNIYFKGISTGAPALNRFTIKKQNDGSFVFFNRKISSEIQDQIDLSDQTPIVTEMKEQVERGLQEACDKDLDLNYLIGILNGESVSEETTETETAETETETTEAETKKSKKKKESASDSTTAASESESQSSEKESKSSEKESKESKSSEAESESSENGND